MIKRFIIFSLVLAVTSFIGVNNLHGQTGKRSVRKVEKSMSGPKRKTSKKKKVREPRAVVKAKKEQGKREKKQDKAYDNAVKQNRNRHYQIQTNDVKERMKQDRKDLKLRDRERKKQQKRGQRKSGAAKKYRKK